jgi:hypothetical protein
MPFTQPQYVNQLDVWKSPRTPSSGAPDFTNVHCQVYSYSKSVNWWLDHTTGKYSPVIILRLPTTTPVEILPGDVMGKFAGPGGIDEFYLLLFRQPIHTGFPNAYFYCPSVRCTQTGAVIVPPKPF